MSICTNAAKSHAAQKGGLSRLYVWLLLGEFLIGSLAWVFAGLPPHGVKLEKIRMDYVQPCFYYSREGCATRLYPLIVWAP